MKRNVISSLAILSLVAAFAAPAMADLDARSITAPGNAVPFPGQAGRSHDLPLCWGILNAPGTDFLPPSYSIVANASSTIRVAFGFKWAYDQPYSVSGNNYGNWAIRGAHFNVFWDSDELSPVLPTPISTFPNGGPALLTMSPVSYSPATLGINMAAVDAGALGITSVGVLFNSGAGTTVGSGGFGMSVVAHDQFVLVGKATFHVDPGGIPDDGLDLYFTGGVSGRFYTDITTSTPTFGETSMTRVWSTLIAPSSVFVFDACPGGFGVVPEPASAGLFGVGLLAIVGGAWRRRRRRLA